jgi:tetrapyrrole methylase family protein/MazG family protein
MKKRLILASQSPRRHELMKSAGFDFETIPAKGEEIITPGSPPEQVVMDLARQKAEEILEANQDATIIGADTIVYLDGDILGKPADSADAYAMLKRLSGRRHTVFTGVAVCEQHTSKSFCERTEVTFHDLSDDEINAYIETDEPFDKAGAYGIQEKGMLLVKEIKGDFYNVMGLPISRLSRELRNVHAPQKTKQPYKINDLLDIMARLRVDCPWDKEQTHESIRVNVIEEAYEVAEAIDDATPDKLCEELGDLLLQVIFHAQIAKEADEYTFDDICDSICKKLIYRHPHVFNAGRDARGATDSTQVLKNWEDLKAESKGEQTTSDRFDSIPKLLPALTRGEKVGKRAAHAGFDFASVHETLECAQKELEELKLAMLHNDEGRIEEEFGDVLFSCCNLGRFLKKDCEKALTFSINRFIMRFRGLEDMVLKSGKKIEQLNSEQLDELWNRSKKAI